MNVLYIDTSSNLAAVVCLKIGAIEHQTTKEYGKNRTQVILPLIHQLLKQNGLGFEDINAIEVNTGPGSFTGLRVGVSIANTLGFVLNIPINNQPIGQLVAPRYT